MLWGDYKSLKRLREFIFEVNEQSAWVADKESFLLSLAYDVRHAAQGDRKKERRSLLDDDDCGLAYGVEMLWPFVIAQAAVLRTSMGFMPTAKWQQAQMYELEAVIEGALRAAIPALADEVLSSAMIVGRVPFSRVAELIYGRCQYFVGLTGKKRLTALPHVLQSLDALYHFWGELAQPPSAGYLPESTFEFESDEWPEFRW